VDISVTVCVCVCFVCICTAVNRRQGRESHILGNFALSEAKNWPVNRPAHALNYN